MKRILGWLFVASVSLVGLACGDDDTDNSSGDEEGTDDTQEPAGDDDGTDDDAPSSEADAGSSGGSETRSIRAVVDCDPDGEGSCQNSTDCELVESGEARNAAVSCGTLHPADGEAATACVVEETEIGQACAACYVGLIGCSAQNCLMACLQDPTSAGCGECQIESGCLDDFDACSGLTSLE